MRPDDDHIEVVGFQIAGPSKSNVTSNRHRRRAIKPRRKAQPALSQDIIEISDSDDESSYEKPVPMTAGKGKARAVGEGTVASPDRRPRVPLFLPDGDNDSDEDIIALLNADGDLSEASPRRSKSPHDKGKRRADVRPVNHRTPPPHPPPPLSVASSPPASMEDIRAANYAPRIAARVLEIVPDVDKDYLEKLIVLQTDSYHSVSGSDWFDTEAQDARVVETILYTLFENADYPRSRNAPPPVDDSRPSGAPIFVPPAPDGLKPSVAGAQAGRGISRSKMGVSNILGADPRAELAAPIPNSDSSLGATSGSADKPNGQVIEPEQDPVSRTVAQVLEIIPDVEPTFLLKLVERQIDLQRVDVSDPGNAALDPYEVALQRVLHSLFETPDYPKMSKKRKRSSEDDGDDAGPAKVRVVEETNYGDKDRARTGGKYYDELALNQLSQDFPGLPHDHVQQRFSAYNRLYAPTYLSLSAERRGAATGSSTAARSRGGSGKKRKGKGKARSDPEFGKERAWLVRKLQEDAAMHGGAEEDEGEGFECGCCFTTYPFSKMTQCPDAHLFCTDCVTNYASTLLGEHNPAIGCMDQSGCKLLFLSSELHRILTPKLLELYERVTQRKELEAAGLENLEECPFCEYQVVIENEQEKLFRCEREECGAVSCRKCKKLDHLPKSCEEAAVDKKLDARHAIEEAMTAALMRNCPSCNKAFIKEAGCNKMVCPHCRTMSCYICRKIIRGYEHFNQAPPYNMPKDNRKCQLWDSDVEQRHAEEVAAAAKRAQEEYKRAHPETNDADIKVDIPKAPPKRVVCNNPNHHHHHHHHQLPPLPDILRAVDVPGMGAPIPLQRAPGHAFIYPGMLEPAPLLYHPPPPAMLPHNIAAMAPAPGAAHLLVPAPAPRPANPRHRRRQLPAPVRAVDHLAPRVQAPLYNPPPQAHAHDLRRNPRRNVAAAAEEMVMLAHGAGAGILGEGMRRAHHVDRAQGRPVKVERHR